MLTRGPAYIEDEADGTVLVLRVLGLVVVGAALVIGLAAGAIYFISTTRLNQKVVIPTESVAIPTDITAIQRGQHLASAVAACAECHGPNLAGKVHVDDPLLARIVAPNLTRGRGGVGATLTNADFVRAIRHGVDPSGRQLLIMPSDDYNNFSDADLGAIVAYVRSLPAINTSLPPNDIRALGLVLFALGQLPLQPAANIDHLAPRSRPTRRHGWYGQYLASATGAPPATDQDSRAARSPGPVEGAVPALQTSLPRASAPGPDFIKRCADGRQAGDQDVDAVALLCPADRQRTASALAVSAGRTAAPDGHTLA